MAVVFPTIYDIQTAGGVPPYSAVLAYAFLFAFLFFSVLVILSSAVGRRKSRVNLVMIPIIGVGMLGYLAVDRWDRHATATALAQGKVTRVEGCIANFVTTKGDSYASRDSRRDEEWDVGGQHFGYKVTSDAPGYHEREARGGVVHQGQYLRVSYLVSPILRRTEIMKIETGPQRCG